MQYLLLIYADERDAEAVPEADRAAEMQRWFDLTAQMKEAGVWRGGEALHPVAAATTVRTEAGKLVAVDGPFAETKEQLGGFYLIDVGDLDQALDWARRIPTAETGSVEVRPILAFP